MPNWCANEVNVYGLDKDIKAFKELVYKDEDDAFSFQRIKPIPLDTTDTYSWCINNWGTKWDACSVDILQEGEDHLEYYFDTAWSPPEEIANTLKQRFPELEFSWFYREDGCQIAGWL